MPLTARSRLCAPVDFVVHDVNTFVRGWAGYFRFGNSADAFDKIMAFADERMALFVGKRHKPAFRSWVDRLVRGLRC